MKQARPVGTARPWRARASLLALIAAGLMFALITAEIVVRKLSPRDLDLGRVQGLYRVDPEVMYTMKPNVEVEHHSPFFRTSIRTNSLGLRDEEVRARVPGTRRLLIMGDSMAWGWGVAVDECFANQLENRTDAEVINASVPGYSNRQELIYLRRLIETIKPDIVLFAVTLENDAFDNERTRTIDVSHLEEREGHLVNTSISLWSIAGVKKFLRRHSRLYGFAVDRIQMARRPELGDPTHNLPERNVMSLFISAPGDSTGSAELGEMASILAEAASVSRQHGAEFRVVLLPFLAMVDDALWAEACDIFGVERTVTDPGTPRRTLEGALGTKTVIDAAVYLRSMRVDSRAFFIPHDGHLSASGHSAVAGAIRDALAPLIE